MKIYRYIIVFALILFIGAGSGCTLVEVQRTAGMFHVNGPYWDGPAQNFTVSHVLNYRQQLRTLSEQLINDEAERVREVHVLSKGPVDQIQYLLILDALPASPDNKQLMEGLFSELNQDTSFMRSDVQELVFLIKEIVSLKLAGQLHRPFIKTTCPEVKDNTSELKMRIESCEEESKALADQIQKLKDIERILNDRELSIEK
nr:hypothetical protein [Desulfobulbaceae bacterium]